MALPIRNAFIILVVALITAASTIAHAVDPVTVSVSSLTPGTMGPAGLTASTTIRAMTGTAAANNSLYYQRAVTFSRASIASAARSRLLGAAAAAIAINGVILGLGWALDELTGQVTAGATPDAAPHLDGTTSFYYPTSQPSYQSGSLREAAQREFDLHGHPSGSYFTVGAYYPPYGGWPVETRQPDGTITRVDAVAFYSPTLSPYTGPNPLGTPGTVITDTQLAEAIAANPAALREVLYNPSGLPNAAITPLPAVMAEVQATHRAVTNNALATGILEPVPASAANSEAAPSEWPAFCDYASKLCAAADFITDDTGVEEDKSIDWQETPTSSSWVSGLATNGTCPAPIVVELLGSNVSFPYTPLCDLSVYLRALILAAAALSAAFIIGGKRNA